MKDDLNNPYDKNASDSKPSKVGFENNDNWEFEASAPTLEDTLIENNEYEIQIPAKKQSAKEDFEHNKSKEKYNTKSLSASSKKRDSTNITKFLIAAILLVIVTGVCVFLGIRYYTTPAVTKIAATDAAAMGADEWNNAEKLTPGNVALTVDGVDISIGMYNFYYNSIVGDYTQSAEYYGIDTTTDYSKQTTTDDNGKEITWKQKFEDDTIYQIKYVVSLYNKAKEAGITLSNYDKEEIQANLESMISSAKEAGYGEDVDSYIAKTYGDYCNYATIAKMLYQSYLARDFYYRCVVETKATNDEVSTYYSQHKNECEAQSFAYLMLEYAADDGEESDSKSLEAVKKDAEKYIAEISKEKTVDEKKAKLKSLISTACVDLVNEYMDYYDKTEEEAVEEITDNFSEASLTSDDTTFTEEGLDWLFSEDVKAGDMTTVVDSDKSIVYVVLKTGESKLLDDPVYSVRHILITPEDDGESTTDEDGNTVYSDAAWQSAKNQAETLLKEYNAGDKTEYSFACLAERNSTDTYSISSGGQGNFGGYYGGTGHGEMVEEFENWATDSARRYGDVDIVKTKFGYHIMFFIENTQQYLYKCSQAVIVGKCQDIIDSTVDNATVVRHKSGMSNTTVAAPTSSESTDTASQGSAYDDDSDNMNY